MPRDGLLVPAIRAQLRLSGPAHDEPAEEEPTVEVGAGATEGLRSPEKCTDNAPVLACPDLSVKMTDASNYVFGGVLTKENDGQERVIAYVSSKLDAVELNYSPTEKECWGIRKLRCYLEGYRCDVITDRLAEKWLD